MLTFTKKIKENWLIALRSGKYEQFGSKLMNPDNSKQRCCLGVLVDLLPDVTISDGGEVCLINGVSVGYSLFNEMNLHEGCALDLTRTNDNSYSEGIRDYSQVIPLIEQLETVD